VIHWIFSRFEKKATKIFSQQYRYLQLTLAPQSRTSTSSMDEVLVKNQKPYFFGQKVKKRIQSTMKS